MDRPATGMAGGEQAARELAVLLKGDGDRRWAPGELLVIAEGFERPGFRSRVRF
jgi:hypothetical protein